MQDGGTIFEARSVEMAERIRLREKRHYPN